MSRSRSDAVLSWSLRLAATLSAALFLVMAAFVAWESQPALSEGLSRFLSDASWHPSVGRYGALPMVAGTVLITAGATALATPIAIACALFCHTAPPRLSQALRRVLELLAGIPSVVFGFWGLVRLVPLIARLEPPGVSVLAGILVLALMILPTIALVADASLRAVPAELMRGAAALGLSRWARLRAVALPAARSGIAVGVVLGAARALGETMAVLMVCGNVVKVPGSLFDPIRTLTANIALEMAYAMGDHRSALFVTGLALLLLIAALVLLAEAFKSRRRYVATA